MTAAVSVVVPVHNGAAFIADALGSILAQDVSCEIIVVDDGSTDQTSAIVAQFGNGIVTIRQRNAGPAAARNAGVACSSGELIAFLDADDLWPKGGLQLQLAQHASRPELAMAWGLSERIVMPGVEASVEDWHGRPQWALALGSMVFRRSAFEAAGGFDERLRIGEDMDLLIRLKESKAPIGRHSGIVHVRRIHAGNCTNDRTAAVDTHYRVLAKTLARQRATRIGSP